jgi:rhodanese-related sulfurtransferase
MHRFFALALLMAGCTKDVTPKVMDVAQAAAQLASKRAVPVDCNTNAFRAAAGWLQGAILLSDYLEYTTTELPSDKTQPLIFYCTGKLCTASHEAAVLALQRGHTDVSVMSEGVKGWKAEGRPLVTFASRDRAAREP